MRFWIEELTNHEHLNMLFLVYPVLGRFLAASLPMVALVGVPFLSGWYLSRKNTHLLNVATADPSFLTLQSIDPNNPSF